MSKTATPYVKHGLAERWSTDTEGIAICLGMQAEAKVELEAILNQIEAKVSPHTLMTMDQPPLSPSLIAEAAEDES
jgi:hypothetical protein